MMYSNRFRLCSEILTKRSASKTGQLLGPASGIARMDVKTC